MFHLEFNVKNAMLLLFAAALTVVGCNSEGKNSSGNDGSIHAENTGESPKAQFKDPRVSAVYNHYLHVKDALVQADSKEAQLGSAALKAALKQINSSEGAAAAEKITRTADLAAQRASFNSLTREIEAVLKKSPVTRGEVFKQYCPMANEGDGGYWFSNDRSIRNPYYGDEMLDCGEVKEVIR
ncbi:MAG TPA: DUF3347 domain-containing protein [Sphingobacteriaceae bacterium]